MRLQRSFQHLTALASRRIADPYTWHRKAALRIKTCVSIAAPHPGILNRSQSSPFEVIARFIYRIDGSLRRCIAAGSNHTGILIFNLRTAEGDLAQYHPYRLQQIQRLEARYDQRLVVVSGDELVGRSPDYHRYVARADEAIAITLSSWRTSTG